MKKIVVFSFACLSFCGQVLAQSCMLYPVPSDEIIGKAAIVVEGKIIGKKSFYGEGNHMIYTSNTIDVYTTLKGNYSQNTIDIISEGGKVGYEMVVAHCLVLK